MGGQVRSRGVTRAPVTRDTCRRWRILEELLRHAPDVICLQEVDHFSTLERALGSVGYIGK